ncbi:MAG: Purine nucleoside phosphorylase [Eubacteriales bacterium SKADARSKE-1]|nr:Purine nucleoside phosphorylase [Eubacteriales bacterium SKADARSKE-1]
MNKTPTPHIAAKANDIAKTVIMPGDPLRAKFIAENFLENIKCFNTVRNVLGFTGTYKNKKISVMGSGMGMPSIGIYSYELYNFYDVDNIIRIGTAGAIADNVNLRDIVLGIAASTDSNYAQQYKLPGNFAPSASYELLRVASRVAETEGLKIKVGNVLSSDVFYNDNKDALAAWKGMGILAVEMEAAALYMNASKANKNALCMLTISDCIFKSGELSAIERQESLIEMIKLALETGISSGE